MEAMEVGRRYEDQPPECDTDDYMIGDSHNDHTTDDDYSPVGKTIRRGRKTEGWEIKSKDVGATAGDPSGNSP